MFLPYVLGVVADAQERVGDLAAQIVGGITPRPDLLGTILYDIYFELMELATELEIAIDYETGEDPGQ